VLVEPGAGDEGADELTEGAASPVQAAATRTNVQAATRGDRMRRITARDAIRCR
jgi:hypothetical protein